MSHFRTVGSLVFAYVPRNLRKKFEKRAKAVFLGYSRNKKAYLAQLLDDGRIIHFEHGCFDETVFPFMAGVKHKWFETQLTGPCHDLEAGPSEHEVRLSLSDDLIWWGDQLNDSRSTTKATDKRADKQALGPLCTPSAHFDDNNVFFISIHGAPTFGVFRCRLSNKGHRWQ